MSAAVEPAHSDAQTARARIDRIAAHVAASRQDIIDAHRERDWLALGYESWGELCTAEFRGAMIALPRVERREAVAEMSDAGMSTRAIGAALGVSDGTVRNDQGAQDYAPAPTPVTGLDGKTYPRPTVTVTESKTIDAETGEIVAPTAQEYASADAGYRAAVLRKELSAWIRKFRLPVALPADEAAELIGTDELSVNILRDTREHFDAWCDAFESSLESNRRLRVVKGN